MRRFTWSIGAWLIAAWVVSGCGGGEQACRSYEYDWKALIPGPGEAGHDAALAAVARVRDRQFHVFHALAHGANTEVWVAREKTTERAAIEAFLRDDDGYDFEAFSGLRVEQVIDGWSKVAGAYAGAGIAADAFRYGTMRDQCYPAEEIDRARGQLLTGLEGLHRALAVTGTEGVIARGYANRNFPGAGQDTTTTPLFDAQGNPLPEEKNNGTWREDVAGAEPDYIWEDSCSRDMLIGWALGFGGAWEVIEFDETIPAAVRDTLRTDARSLALAYRVVRPSGYDLEVPDADGRTTYHGYLNENNVDRVYMEGAQNGFYAIMALGILGALADVADDPEVDAFLSELIEQRDLCGLARYNMMMVNMGLQSNFSNYNMSFQGAWLALRHLKHARCRLDVREALRAALYEVPGEDRQPVDLGQTFFDLTYAAGQCDAVAGAACREEPDQAAIERGLQTLREFPAPPFWEFGRTNCDEAEIASGVCTADDGTRLDVLGYLGRNGDLICQQPLPMRLRPASNYYWRSNPFIPNGGADGPGMFPGVDFRLAYWSGRWVRRPQ